MSTMQGSGPAIIDGMTIIILKISIGKGEPLRQRLPPLFVNYTAALELCSLATDGTQEVQIPPALRPTPTGVSKCPKCITAFS